MLKKPLSVVKLKADKQKLSLLIKTRSTAGFIAAYGILPVYAGTFLFYKIAHKTKWVKLVDMDLTTCLSEFETLDKYYKEVAFVPHTRLEKFWDWVSPFAFQEFGA